MTIPNVPARPFAVGDTLAPDTPPALAELPQLRRFSASVICAGHPNEAQFAACAEAGVEVVVNLSLHGQKYSLPDSMGGERGLLEGLGVVYVHIPVPFDAPVPDHLEQFYAAMDAHAGKRILVHCVVNKRATAFLALYAIHHGGDADDWLWWMRETWEPEDHAPWGDLVRQASGRA